MQVTADVATTYQDRSMLLVLELTIVQRRQRCTDRKCQSRVAAGDHRQELTDAA